MSLSRLMITIILSAVIPILSACNEASPADNEPFHAWTDLSAGLVAHGGGGLLNVLTPNCKEALITNYRRGHRVFEIDLNLTTDGELVAVHDWPSYSGPLSLSEFKERKVADVFTTIDLDDIYMFMLEHTDVYLVTDTKSFEYTNEEMLLQFKLIREKALEHDAELLDRVIPQVYNEEMYAQVIADYPYKSVIYTLYAANTTDERVVQFVKDKPDIKVITMPYERFSDDFYTALYAVDKLIYLHTLNDLGVMREYKERGVHGFYTDYITPEIMYSTEQ